MMNPEPPIQPQQPTAEDVMRFVKDPTDLQKAKQDLLDAGLSEDEVDDLYRKALREHVQRQLPSRQQRRAAERAARKAEARGATTDRQAWLGKLAQAIAVQR